jgi:hypothetical protein
VGRKKGESEEKGEEKVPGAKRGKRGQNYLIDAELWLTFALCPRPLRPIDNGLIYHSPFAVASQALLFAPFEAERRSRFTRCNFSQPPALSVSKTACPELIACPELVEGPPSPCRVAACRNVQPN